MLTKLQWKILKITFLVNNISRKIWLKMCLKLKKVLKYLKNCEYWHKIIFLQKRRKDKKEELNCYDFASNSELKKNTWNMQFIMLVAAENNKSYFSFFSTKICSSN